MEKVVLNESMAAKMQASLVSYLVYYNCIYIVNLKKLS